MRHLVRPNATARGVARSLWLYTTLVAAVTAFSWADYLHSGIFMRRPFFGEDDRFHDLTFYVAKTAHLYRNAATLGSGLPIFTYPAPAAFVYQFFLHTLPSHPVALYLSFLAVCITGFATLAWRATGGTPEVRLACGAAIAITATLGYPLLFTGDRGNIEGVVWALAAAGVCFLLGRKYGAGAVLIGVAASIKPMPILFLLLLVRQRRYKEMALGAATAVGLFVVALTILGPNPVKAYQQLKPGVSLYTQRYVQNLAPVDEARFDHSLLDGMKSLALAAEMHGFHEKQALNDTERLRAEPGGWPWARRLARIYPAIAALGFCLLLATFHRMPTLNRLTAIAVAITLFPLSAGDYTLLHLYVPFGVLLIFLTREVASSRDQLSASVLATLVIYALLFSPSTPLMIFAGDFKLLLLLALLAIMARTPMFIPFFDRGREPAYTRERSTAPEPGQPSTEFASAPTVR